MPLKLHKNRCHIISGLGDEYVEEDILNEEGAPALVDWRRDASFVVRVVARAREERDEAVVGNVTRPVPGIDARVKVGTFIWRDHAPARQPPERQRGVVAVRYRRHRVQHTVPYRRVVHSVLPRVAHVDEAIAVRITLTEKVVEVRRELGHHATGEGEGRVAWVAA